jgi:hypothetical protein
MADWVTISSLATAGGTLVLAAATFGATRSANRSARLAELALQERRRPVLVNSRDDDRAQTVSWPDRPPISLPGGGVAVEFDDDAVHLAISLRNVGAGLAVLQGWYARAEVARSTQPPAAPEDFRWVVRDQYVASGDVGFWQGALRDPSDPLHSAIGRAAAERRRFTVDILYTDHVGGQRTITRFGVLPADGGRWMSTAALHWYLDAPAPRERPDLDGAQTSQPK